MALSSLESMDQTLSNLPNNTSGDSSLPSFQRIGRLGRFFQYSLEQHTEFIAWWTSTPWVIHEAAAQTTCYDLVSRLCWNSTSRTSEYWRCFNQAADRESGEPALVCQKCKKNLAHPNTKGTGTKAMKNHVLSAACRQQVYTQDRQGRERQASLNEIFAEAVSID